MDLLNMRNGAKIHEFNLFFFYLFNIYTGLLAHAKPVLPQVI